MNIPGNRTNTARQAARLGATAAEWQKVLDRNLSQTLYNTVAFVEAALADRYGMETPERFEEAAQAVKVANDAFQWECSGLGVGRAVEALRQQTAPVLARGTAVYPRKRLPKSRKERELLESRMMGAEIGLRVCLRGLKTLPWLDGGPAGAAVILGEVRESWEQFLQAAQDAGEDAAYEMVRRKLRQVHGCEVELVQEEEAPVYVAEW